MASRLAPRRSPEQEAAFRASIAETVGRHRLSAVVAPDTKLRRAGRGLKGLCPFHKERTPSFYVYDAGANFHCYGCGKNGDTLDYLMAARGLTFREALAWLGTSDLPVVPPSERAKWEREESAARRQDIADARAFWAEGVDPRGTPVETYLRGRAITMALPPSIRFGIVPPWRDRETGQWAAPLPAMLCAVYDKGGEVVGIQRVFLRPDGSGKARMRKPKLTLGRIRGASMRLGPPLPKIIVCEGPEDGLSLAQELPDCSVWPTLGTGLMAAVEYPPEVVEIVIAGQNDSAGRTAAEAAAELLLEQGFAVRTMYPDAAFKDWNDQLRGMAQ